MDRADAGPGDPVEAIKRELRQSVVVIAVTMGAVLVASLIGFAVA